MHGTQHEPPRFGVEQARSRAPPAATRPTRSPTAAFAGRMTELPLTGGCNGGAVRFEVTEPLVMASYCHCRRCQRRSGAASSPSAHPAPGAFRVVAGHDKLRSWKPGEGARSGSAANAARRCSDEIPATPTRSRSGWGHSTRTPEFAPAFAGSLPLPRRGSRSPTTGYLETLRVVTAHK